MSTLALDKAFEHTNALISTSKEVAMQLKASGLLDAMAAPAVLAGGGSDWQSRSKSRESYAYFHSWVYAAVNALASEAASQPVCVGRVKNAVQTKKHPNRTKDFLDLMPKNIRHKATNKDIEILSDHELQRKLERPNPIQHKFQFVYSIVANLNLTGRAYIIMDEGEDGPDYYALPTTWVRPDHTKGPYAQFHIQNPRDASGYFKDDKPLDASQVAMIYLPNPADPLGSMSPSSCMSAAIRVDDRIQTCQEKFFDNGIFPSVVVTIGKDPHPDVSGEGKRPRLTGTQRRQVVGAIRRVMGGVANFGNPAIVDGLIENITRLSSTQNELGWDKSEDKLKMRILSAFCVHPFILGEPMGVGGYSQSYNIEKRFCARVNVFLDLLSIVMTQFCKGHNKEEEEKTTNEELLIWYEKLKPVDPSLEDQNWRFARTNGDISKNEFRTKLGLPPDEDSENTVIQSSMMQGIVALLAQVGSGAVQPEQAAALLVGMGIPEDLADKVSGVGQGLTGIGNEGGLPEATEALNEAVAALRFPVQKQIENVMLQLGCE